MYKSDGQCPSAETGIGCRGMNLSLCAENAVQRYRELYDGENPNELMISAEAAEAFRISGTDKLRLVLTNGVPVIMDVTILDEVKIVSNDKDNPNPVPIFLSGPTGFTQLCQGCQYLKMQPEREIVAPAPCVQGHLPEEKGKPMPVSAMDLQLMDALRKIVESIFPKEAAKIRTGAQLAALIIDLFKELHDRRSRSTPPSPVGAYAPVRARKSGKKKAGKKCKVRKVPLL